MSNPPRASSGGVRNLRAMFETSDGNSAAVTSPSSNRGRSPAGSVSSAGGESSSRPLSKVRTSFVAVEPSVRIPQELPGLGQNTKGINERLANSPFAARKESFTNSDERPGEKELIGELKRVVSPTKESRERTSSGVDSIAEDDTEVSSSEMPTLDVKPVEDVPEVNKEESPPANGLSSASYADKPVDTKAEVDEKLANHKNEEAVSDEPPPQEPAKALPTLNPEEATKDKGKGKNEVKNEVEVAKVAEKPVTEAKETIPEAPQTNEKSAPPALAEEHAAASATAPNPVQPSTTETKEAPVEKAPKPQETIVKASSVAPAVTKTAANEPAKKTEKLAATPGRPAPISVESPKSSKPTPAQKSPKKSPLIPKTPTSAKAPQTTKPPAAAKSTAVAPKQPAAKAPTKAPAKAPATSAPKASAANAPTPPKEPTTKASRSSLRNSASLTPAARPAAQTTKPAVGAPVATRILAKAPAHEPFVKPRPKSPTKPLKLAERLTAPTASSAAKHLQDPGNTSSGRPANSSAARKSSPSSRRPEQRVSSGGAPAAAAIRRPESRSSRTSGGGISSGGGASSSKPRESDAGRKVDEGFLARMMRPTAASASKVRDEAKKVVQPVATKVKTNGLKTKASADKVAKERREDGGESHDASRVSIGGEEQEADAGAERQRSGSEAPSLPAIETVASPVEEKPVPTVEA